MSRVFCAHCGNKTLKKVSVTVSDDGTLHMHFSRNPKVLNPRGLRVSGTASPTLTAEPRVAEARPLSMGSKMIREKNKPHGFYKIVRESL